MTEKRRYALMKWNSEDMTVKTAPGEQHEVCYSLTVCLIEVTFAPAVEPWSICWSSRSAEKGGQ